jgi:hypothetical protein
MKLIKASSTPFDAEAKMQRNFLQDRLEFRIEPAEKGKFKLFIIEASWSSYPN